MLNVPAFRGAELYVVWLARLELGAPQARQRDGFAAFG